MRCHGKALTGLTLLLAGVVSAAAPPVPELAVAVVRTPAGRDPSAAYRLFRGEREVTSLVPDMRVANGDRIRPLAGVRVRLVYINTGCGEREVAEETVVACNPTEQSSAAGFLDLLSDQVGRLMGKLARQPLRPTQTLTMRGHRPGSAECFPPEMFQVSPWPGEGAALLPGEPAWFRWELDAATCQPAELVIVRMPGGADGGSVVPMRIGELVRVSAGLDPGGTYEWFVRETGKAISPRFHFRVLGVEAAGNVRRQLVEVAASYHGREDLSPCLAQALYLQVLSDATPGLDLYAESLRLIDSCPSSGSAAGALAQRVREHGLPAR